MKNVNIYNVDATEQPVEITHTKHQIKDDGITINDLHLLDANYHIDFESKKAFLIHYHQKRYRITTANRYIFVDLLFLLVRSQERGFAQAKIDADEIERGLRTAYRIIMIVSITISVAPIFWDYIDKDNDIFGSYGVILVMVIIYGLPLLLDFLKKRLRLKLLLAALKRSDD